MNIFLSQPVITLPLAFPTFTMIFLHIYFGFASLFSKTLNVATYYLNLSKNLNTLLNHYIFLSNILVDINFYYIFYLEKIAIISY